MASFSIAIFVTGLAQDRFITEQVTSPTLGAVRTMRIYLPPSYHSNPGRRYPVLYVQDGQNVFSTAGTNVAFGWGNWELDRTADRLAAAGAIQEILLVAVDNGPARLAEYSGAHAVDVPGPSNRTGFESYAAFVVGELKPRIDASHRTLPGPAHTAVMGSSLGGLCSVALAWDHPEIFGGAASLSGAFQVGRTNFLNSVLRTYQGKPKPIRIYLDSGVVDFTGGDDGRSLSASVATEFRRIGWADAEVSPPDPQHQVLPPPPLRYYLDARTLSEVELEKAGLRRDKWKEAQTSQHNEFYWRLRVGRALSFLFPPLR